MAEITKYGFERETYPEVLAKVKDIFRQTLGVSVQLNDDNILGHHAAILAKLQNDNNRLAEAIWSSQRLEGAEGVYLDDIFSKNGIYRRGKQPSSGDIILELDSTVPSNQTVPITTQFIGSNNQVYQPTSEVLLTSSVIGYKLALTDITDTSYSVTLISTIDGTTNNLTFTNDGTDASKITMIQSIYSAWLNYTSGNSDRIFIDNTNNILYVGYYISNSELVGLKESTEFQISPNVGTKYCSVNVKAVNAGYYPLPANGIKSITPTFSGLLSTKNIISFYSGSEIESDAEYRERYFSEIAALSGSTRDGIVSSVLKVSGVSKVTLYDNPTLIDQDFADALTFHIVVLGGTNADVAQAIYESKPINTQTYGALSYAVSTLDGDTETIRHSNASQVEVDVRVNYKTLNRVPLSSTEKTEIITGLKDYFSSLKIGSVLYNAQVLFIVLNSISRNRVLSVTLDMKLSSLSDSAFGNSDLTPNYTELFVLRDGGVSFNQLV